MIGRHTAALLLGLANVPGLAHGQAINAFPYDRPPGLTVADELLPDGRALCLKLGLDPTEPGRCNALAVLARSMQQADRALWFSKATAGSSPPMNCPGALMFDRSRANGTTTHLCRAPEADAAITQDELAALTAEAHRLNAIPRKTLAEHTRALALKTELDCITGDQVQDCD